MQKNKASPGWNLVQKITSLHVFVHPVLPLGWNGMVLRRANGREKEKVGEKNLVMIVNQ